MVSSLEREKSLEQYDELQRLFNAISLDSEAETTERESSETDASSERDFEVDYASLANQEEQHRDVTDNTLQPLDEMQDVHIDLGALQLQLNQATLAVSRITMERNISQSEYACSVRREAIFYNRMNDIQEEYDEFKKAKEMDRIECVNQINYLTKERDNALTLASEANTQLNQANIEISNLKHNQINLFGRIEQREKELQAYQKENSNLQECIVSRNREFIVFKNRTDTLNTEYISLNNRLESTTAAYNAEKEAVKKKLEDIQAQAKKFENKCAELVTKSNDSGRLAFEFKKKFMEAEEKFIESEKKLAESEKKLCESEKKISEFESKLEEKENKLKPAETATATANVHINNSFKVVKEKETLEEEKKNVEEVPTPPPPTPRIPPFILTDIKTVAEVKEKRGQKRKREDGEKWKIGSPRVKKIKI